MTTPSGRVPITDLTSADAVRQAIAEFDRLGREAFLQTYEFGPAREYFLEVNGRRYDSKAIAGVAYGYQYPTRGPLKGKDFSGGQATVQKVLETLGFTIVVERAGRAPVEPPILTVVPPPARASSRGTGTRPPRVPLNVDFIALARQQQELGTQGELLVVQYEQQQLRAAGRADLAERVEHVAVTKGEGLGYDVLSYLLDGTEKYIEVKTTTGPADTTFFLTINEVLTSQQYASQYHLYRVFAYDQEQHQGSLYQLQGDLTAELELEPMTYRARRGAPVDDAE